MKRKLIAQLVSGALGLAVIGVAQAGTINSTQVQVAREVITSNTQSIGLPQISYTYVSSIGGDNVQQFQIQLILRDGLTWAVAPAAGDIKVDAIDSATNASVTGALSSVAIDGVYLKFIKSAISTDGTTAYINIDSVAGKTLRTPIFKISGTSNTAVAPAASNETGTVKGFKALADKATSPGTDSCVKQITAGVEYKHFASRPGDGTIATSAYASVNDETSLANSSNIAPSAIKIVDALRPVVTASVNDTAGGITIDLSAASLGKTFKSKVGTADKAGPSVTPSTATTSTGLKNAVLGSVYVQQVNTGPVDIDGKSQYLLSKAAVLGTANASKVDGTVEALSLDVSVTGTFQSTGALALCTAAELAGIDGTEDAATLATECAATGASKVGTSTSPLTSPVKLTYKTALTANAADGAAPDDSKKGNLPALYLVYAVDGKVAVPTSSFNATATLTKSPDTTGAAAIVGESTEADVCSGDLYSLGGAVKIDVRNYLSANSGFNSMVRLINNSETNTANVYGQWIDEGGKFGNYGLVATIPARGVVNLTNSALEAKMNTAGKDAAGTPKGTGSGGRIRFTSDNGTLRVQNYVQMNGNWLEWSSAQGADSTGNAEDDTYGTATGQDARAGIDGK